MHTQRRVIDGVEVTATTREPLKSTIWVQMPGGEWELLGEMKDLHMRAASGEPTLIAWGPKPPTETETIILASPEPYKALLREALRPIVQETIRKLQKTPGFATGEAQWKAERRGRGGRR